MHNLIGALSIALASILVAGCGDDPVSFSQPVTITLKAKSGDVTNAVVSDEKSITTESGNPYGSFVSDAQAALDGHDPSRIEIDSVSLLLGGQSTGVTTLDEIFGGQVDVLFVMNDSNNSHPAAEVVGPTSAGPVALSSLFDSDAMADADFDKLVQGSFKVVIRGAAATTFETKGAEADLQLTFEFTAFE
jgi:hypothetical protein